MGPFQLTTRSLAVRSAALAAVAALVPATLAARPMTPEDLARLRQVDEAALSPDGTAVAYAVDVPRIPFEDEDGPAWSELWVVAPGSEPRPYVTGEGSVSDLAWTPDGESISFLAKGEAGKGDGEDEEPKGALWAIPLAGGGARTVLEHPTGVKAYSWAPDGRRVAFLAGDEEPEGEEALEKDGFDQKVYEEDWTYTRLWIAEPALDPEPVPPAEAAEAPKRRIELSGDVREVHWCPGGERLAVKLAPTPSVDDSYVATRLRVVDPATGEITARIENPGKLGEVAWSPDCSALAFVAAADRHDPAAGRLTVASAETGAFHDVLPGYEGHVRDVAWSDGDTLVFLGDEGVVTLLYQLDLPGAGPADGEAGDPRLLAPAGRTQWSGLSLSRDGSRFAVLGQSARHPDEVFFGELGTAGEPDPRRLTETNPWLDQIDFAPQEVVEYEARDGLELQGILIRPLDEDPDRRYPLIEVVHGGPEAHIRDGWETTYSRHGQVAAGRGYAVFYPNYRGSTGRGVEFSKLSQARPAKEEFDDLVDGVDHLVSTGLVDRGRVGITGGSYGGYATAWGATYYTERYAAGVMAVGISDKISKLGTSDIPEELHLVHERKRLWDDWQHFLEASPLYHVEKARTPLLILHGEEDTRVHPSQSLELHRA
ncbi:MAG: S9 family peptidase, partial [Thermoanaerobaculia bacterium]